MLFFFNFLLFNLIKFQLDRKKIDQNDSLTELKELKENLEREVQNCQEVFFDYSDKRQKVRDINLTTLSRKLWRKLYLSCGG